MRLRPLATLAMAAVALAACAPPGPAVPPLPTPTASASSSTPLTPEDPRTSPPSRSETREPEPTPTPSPSPDATLPADFPLDGSLVDNAEQVVAELHRVAGGLPALKLDVATEQATLTVATRDGSHRSYRWRDGVVSVADSDVQNLGQARFDPTAYPWHDLPRILDVAALFAGSSENQVMQVVEFRAGDVYMTVSTRPETRTVFFHRDGTAVLPLSTHGVADIAAGLAEVTGSARVVLAVGFNDQQGFWADVPRPQGVIERRTRTGTLPMFAAQRTQTLGLTPFDPGLLDPAAIAMAIARYREDPDQTCAVEIDNRFQRTQPVIRYDCSGSIHYSDMVGRDMTAQLQD